MTARDIARKKFASTPVRVLSLNFERCQNTYGVAPCTATGGAGEECYYARPDCQDLPNFNAGIKTLKICDRGAPIPAGEMLLPLLEKVSDSPTELVIEKGVARRSHVTITITDDDINDAWQDPHWRTRATPAGSTFILRLLARNRAIQGMSAQLSYGFVTDPWDWTTFIDGLYQVEAFDSTDKDREYKIVVKCPTKAADTVLLPVPSKGALVTELKDYENTGVAQGGAVGSITLSAEASAIDDAYNGMAVRITDLTGAGQERIISDYVGATRVATVSVNWLVAPDSSSIYFVQALQLEVDTDGEGYEVYGVPGVVRLGEEWIKFTSRVGNVLSWPDTTYRQQSNTPLETHDVDAQVQVCKIFEDEKYTDVIKWFYTESGLPLVNIDSANFTAQDNAWLAAAYTINAGISEPRKATDYVEELLIDCVGVVWWSPFEQLLKLLLIRPSGVGTVVATLDENTGLIDSSVKRETLHDVRLTTSALKYNLKYPTANASDANNYLRGTAYGDETARVEYGGLHRTEIRYSRFFTAGNTSGAFDSVSRAQVYRRDAPLLITCHVTQKDYNFNVGEQRDLLTSKVVDKTGQRLLTRVLITKVVDKGDYIELKGRSTIFNQRFAFFAPNGTPDYPNNNGYACFCLNTGLMADDTDGYVFS